MRPMNLINELKAIQERHGYLPEAELRAFAQRTATPLYQIQAVASFYPHFRLRPRPQLEVKVCADLSCHLAGARRIHRAAERNAATLPGCEVGAVSCLGRCDQAPAVVINDTIYAGVDDKRLAELLTAFHNGTVPDTTLMQHGSTPLTLDPYSHEAEHFAALREVLATQDVRSEEHTSELQSPGQLVATHSFPTRRPSDLPAVVINDTIYAGVDDKRLAELLTAFHNGTVPDTTLMQHGSTPLTLDPYSQEAEHFAALREVLATQDVDKIIKALDESGLRGMGGAGFPTDVKWESVRNTPGAEKDVVVSADDSEPGTVKDRFRMERFPHLLIEGLLL